MLNRGGTVLKESEGKVDFKEHGDRGGGGKRRKPDSKIF